MMNNKDFSGVMYLTSPTAVALWHNEISGQISDGHWENSGPRDHWQFWCNMSVQLGLDNVASKAPGAWCRKNSYAIERLHNLKWDVVNPASLNGGECYILRDRMLKIGRMAKAWCDPTGDLENLRMAEYMPSTLEAFRAAKLNNTWDYSFVGDYMANVTDEIAVKFYESTYTLKELIADVKLIKATMKQIAVG